MIRWLYALAMTCAQPLLRRRLARRGRVESGYLGAIGERFGRYASPVLAGAGEADDAGAALSTLTSTTASPSLPAQTGWVWIHAVSLGETRAAAVLLAELRRQQPDLRLLLTHGTATGRAEGLSLLREGDCQVWQPWDAPGAVSRFLDHFKPRIGILLETEVWPNLTAACRQRGVPLLLVNARLSAKSLARASALAWLARPAYRALTAVYAQTLDDAHRLALLGAPVKGVLGNLKFDAEPQAAVLAHGRDWRAGWQAACGLPVIAFAVSREGEEALLLEAIAALSASRRQSVQWLIVPRHPQRFDGVAALVQASGCRLSRRSTWPDSGPPTATAPSVSPDDGPSVWLGDSLGEMPLYYALSDVALLGGSFLPLGGQNLIEAAACGCPVVMGPHTFNFAQAAANSAAAGSAFEVASMSAALARAFELVHDPVQLNASRAAADRFVRLHKGAAAKTAAAIGRLL
jgi:3-deoxy-D-manno-octulosonic-acid transferase